MMATVLIGTPKQAAEKVALQRFVPSAEADSGEK